MFPALMEAAFDTTFSNVMRNIPCVEEILAHAHARNLFPARDYDVLCGIKPCHLHCFYAAGGPSYRGPIACRWEEDLRCLLLDSVKSGDLRIFQSSPLPDVAAANALTNLSARCDIRVQIAKRFKDTLPRGNNTPKMSANPSVCSRASMSRDYVAQPLSYSDVAQPSTSRAPVASYLALPDGRRGHTE